MACLCQACEPQCAKGRDKAAVFELGMRTGQNTLVIGWGSHPQCGVQKLFADAQKSKIRRKEKIQAEDRVPVGMDTATQWFISDGDQLHIIPLITV